jgi:hypothetical protein
MTKIDDDDDDDIDPEEGNENVKTEIPFNPNDISINIIPRTIGQLVEMLRYGEIIIPSYQRLPDLWSDKKKSRFIESLMLNLPTPLFYFDEAENKNWKVVDGLQRISTLEHFIILDSHDKDYEKNKRIGAKKSPLVLEDLEFKTEFNGKTWSKIPRDIQRRIETNQITINLIGKGTPEAVKYNIFSRINQGGEELRAQEIRTALFQGEKMEFLEKLISKDTEEGKSFLKATDNSIKSRRQDDLDFATRFLSFYLLGHENYKPDMDFFMITGMKSIPENISEQKKILNNFKKAMEIAYGIFGTNAFRKIIDSKRSKINKPLFEILSVSFARLNEIEQNKLLKKKNECKNAFIKMLKDDQHFEDYITKGTSNKDRVHKRHEIFSNFLRSFIS